MLVETLPDLAAVCFLGLGAVGAALSMWLVACQGADKAVSAGVPVVEALAGALEAVLRAKGKGKEIPEPADLKRKLVEEFGDKRGHGWSGAATGRNQVQVVVPVERAGTGRALPVYGGHGYGGFGGGPAPKAPHPRLVPGPNNPCLMCGSIIHLIQDCPDNKAKISATLYRQIAASQGLPIFEGPSKMKALPAP